MKTKWIGLLALGLAVAFLFAEGPSWWLERGIIESNAGFSDFSVANQGQVKHIAQQAYLEFDEKLGEASPAIYGLVSGFSTTDNYLVANLGQLKTVSTPFYDQLYSLNLTNTWPAGMTVGPYPWSGSTNLQGDYVAANIGQLKYLFSFDLLGLSVASISGNIGYEGGITGTVEIVASLWGQPWAGGYRTEQNQVGPYMLEGVSIEHLYGVYAILRSMDETQWAWGSYSNNPVSLSLSGAQNVDIPLNDISENTDTDSDGLPDSWELNQGLNPLDPGDVLEDPDGDQIPNRYEHVYQTLPMDPASFPTPTVIVTNGAGLSLQQAVSNAISAATNGYPMVKVLRGVYTNSGDRDITLNTSNILLYTENSFGETIIDCQQEGRAFYVSSGRPILSGFIMRDGKASDGAGIWVGNASPLIVNCVLMGHEATDDGGAFYCESEEDADQVPVIQNCTLVENSALDGGGGVYDFYGRTVIRNSILWGNRKEDTPSQIYGQPQATYSCIQGGYSRYEFTEWGCPIRCATGTQVIYPIEEIGTSGTITSLALRVTERLGQSLTDFTIRIKETPLTHYSSANLDPEGWTQVYQNDETISTIGVVTFVFQTPFNYSGTQSLLVDFSFDPEIYPEEGTVEAWRSSSIYRSIVFFEDEGDFVGEFELYVPVIWLGIRGQNVQVIPKEHNMGSDPQFASDGWRLTANSPCIDAGELLRAPGCDLEGEVRAIPVDIGADEFVDTDKDGLMDRWEWLHFGNLDPIGQGDEDVDGLTNLEEQEAGTDPLVADSDGDGLTDGEEVHTYGTDPLDADSDDDGIPDGWEAEHGLDPLSAEDGLDDPDGDRVPNLYEYVYQTIPTNVASVPTPTVIVTNGAGVSLQQAVCNAISAVTNGYPIVKVLSGVYTNSGDRDITLNTSNILLYAENSFEKTIIDGQEEGRAFYITGGRPVISGFVIQNGSVENYGGGGGIYIHNEALPLIVNCVLVNNRAVYYGGGVYYGERGYDADEDEEEEFEESRLAPVLQNCTLLNNYAGYDGGGVAVDTYEESDSRLVIRNTILWGNEADDGPPQISGFPEVTYSCIEEGYTRYPVDDDGWRYPFATRYHAARTQVIYPVEEIGTSGTMTSLTLRVSTVPGQSMTHFMIRMKETPLTHYPGINWEANGWTQVYQNDETVHATGLVTFVFQTPFNYSGAHSLMVDFSFNNQSSTSDGYISAWDSGSYRSITGYGDLRDTDRWTRVPLIWLGVNGELVEVKPKEQNMDQDPQLAPDGWRLTADSPCIDAGDLLHAPGSDIEGQARETLVDIGADEFVYDSDDDGLADSWERRYFGDLTPTVEDDPDADGLTNLEEQQAQTNPTSADTDGDALPDPWEVEQGLDPLSPENRLEDPDGDQIPNLYEYVYQTLPTNALSLPPPTVIVTNGGGVSLQQAVSNAISAATNGYPMVRVLRGIYTNSTDRDLTLNTSNILLYTEGGFEGAVIDCQQDGRAFYIMGGHPVISGFVIQNGSESSGGGIYAYSGSPWIVNCVVINNDANYGGGLYVEENAYPVLENCTLFNNRAYSGCGLYDRYGRAVIRNTLLWDNEAKEDSGEEYYVNSAQIYGSSDVTYSCIQGGYDRYVLTSWVYPFYTRDDKARTQVIYPVEEIGRSGTITSLTLRVTTVPGRTLRNFTLRMMESTLTNYAEVNWETEGLRQVYQNDETISSTGLVTFAFHESFNYSGENSLMVDFSYDSVDDQSYRRDGYIEVWNHPEAYRSIRHSIRGDYYGDPKTWYGTYPGGYLSRSIPVIWLGIDGQTIRAGLPQEREEHNIESDPQLVPNDWRLTGTSSCIDVGDSLRAPGSDIDGEMRDLFIDIGADEWVDTDGDTLSDSWEHFYFGDLSRDGHGDADEDGLNDRDEYHHGTAVHHPDTDEDGLTDGEEVRTHGSDPLAVDTDEDEMPDGWEVTYGLNPVDNEDALADLDGDQIPNLYEYIYQTFPSDRVSMPSPTVIVTNGAGLTLKQAVEEAIEAATNGYPMVKVLSGVYTNSGDRDISLYTSNILLYTESGFERAVIDCQKENRAFYIGRGRPVISGFVIQNGSRSDGGGIYVSSASPWIVNCAFINNKATGDGGAFYFSSWNSTDKPTLQNCTFVNNRADSGGGVYFADEVYVDASLVIRNTILWGNKARSGSQIYVDGESEVSHSYIEGGYSGTNNSSVDPQLVLRGWRLTSDSPCINAGAAPKAPGSDIEGEGRNIVDIGADEWVDVDDDHMADSWERFYFGDLSPDGQADGDEDGLNDRGEYENSTTLDDRDSDNDGLTDGQEVHTYGTDPLTGDTDHDEMDDRWEIIHGLDPLRAEELEDADGDQIPNIYEYRYQTIPTSKTSLPTPTVIVTNGAGLSLQQAVNHAISAATNGYPMVKVLSGVYTNSADRDIQLVFVSNILLYAEGAYEETVIDCQNSGRAFYIHTSQPVFSGFVIKNGVEYSGGGIYMYNSSPWIVNCVLMNNRAEGSWGKNGHGGAVAITERSYPVLQNCTLVNNTALSSGGGIYDSEGGAIVRNTILWGNEAESDAQIAGDPVVSYSCIEGGWTGEVNITEDPLLEPNSWRLSSSFSSCLGQGDPVGAPVIDIEGQNRGSAIDIGAHEFGDMDDDGLKDLWELFYFGDLSHHGDTDDDGDGLTNEEEQAIATDPTLADTDTDGLSDSEEITQQTDPLDPDSDDDEMNDGWETRYGFDPLEANAFEDPDGDQIPNLYEYIYQTIPTNQASLPTPTVTVRNRGMISIQEAVEKAIYTATNGYPMIKVFGGVYTEHDIMLSTPNILLYTEGGSEQTVIDCQEQGRAFTIPTGRAVISGFVIQNGSASSGGGMFVGTASPLIVNCLFIENVADKGGGIFVNDDGSPRIVNSLFMQNRADAGGGLYISHTSALLIQNCTVINNNASSSGGGVHNSYGRSLIRNTIVWGNVANYGPQIFTYYRESEVTYSCIEGGYTGTNNIAADPQLVSNSWRLTADSPCIDMGSELGAWGNDTEGEAREASVDIGADEWVDTDNDDLADAWERFYFGDLTPTAAADDDGDGFSHQEEYELYRTDPSKQDTDGDELTDSEEIQSHNTDPLDPDTDEDGMIDSWEIAHGLDPFSAEDALDDPDDDQIPNLYEYIYQTIPTNSASFPTPTVTVTNGAALSLQQAVSNAISLASSGYPIVKVLKGIYSNSADRDITLNTSNILLYAEASFEGTVIDCQQSGRAFTIAGRAVISGFVIQNGSTSSGGGIYVKEDAPWIVNCVLMENHVSNDGGGLYVHENASLVLQNCTLLNNRASGYGGGVYDNDGGAVIRNTILWGNEAYIGRQISGTPKVSYSCIQDGYSGISNSATDPRFVLKGWRLTSPSPCINSGTELKAPENDIEGEPRTAGVDIGADEWVDTDEDGLADAWEKLYFEDLSPTAEGDDDSDGSVNLDEYLKGTRPDIIDTDGDGLMDGDEVIQGSDPLNPDSDDDEMVDGWEIEHGLDPLSAEDALDDPDGDQIPNLYEYIYQTIPTNVVSLPDPTVTVTNGAGLSLQRAVSNALRAAPDGYPIVKVLKGIYTNSADRDITLDTPNILLYAENSFEGTIIDAQNSGRAFYISSGRPVISGFVIQNGSTNSGGGIYVNEGSPLIVNCVLIENKASYSGGGLYVSDGDPVLQNCTVMNNRALSHSGGGGAFSGYSGAVIRNTIFWGNEAHSGSSQIGGAPEVTYSCIDGGYTNGPLYVLGYPFSTDYNATRMQIIYPVEEIENSGAITSLTLEVRKVPGQTMTNFSIRMRETSLTNYPNVNWETNAWTQVYQNDETISAVGPATFAFQAPFNYSGNHSLMVDFSFENQSHTTYGYILGWNSDVHRSIYYQTRSDYGDPRDWHTTWPGGNRSTYVPVIWLGIEGKTLRAGLPKDSNISTDPQFVSNSWRLTAGSPCMDAGEASHAPGSDIEGETRDEVVDMGADEWVDSDTDGLADQWEQFYFGDLNPTAEADDDSDGLVNLDEFLQGTQPDASDTDGDRLNDGEEVNGYHTDPLKRDTDGDEVSDGDEVNNGTDPLVYPGDTDGDEANDHLETAAGTIVTNATSFPTHISGELHYSGIQTGKIWVIATTLSNDCSFTHAIALSETGAYTLVHLPNLTNYWIKAYRDSNGNLSNDYWEASGEYPANPYLLSHEVNGIDVALNDPTNSLDADAFPDGFEIHFFGNLTHEEGGDEDEDGLTNLQEYQAQTDPTKVDTDGDGLTDGEEMSTYHTDPLAVDTDGDEMSDGWEITYHLDPLDPTDDLEDPDGDQVPNVYEYVYQTLPTNSTSIPTPTVIVTNEAGLSLQEAVTEAISAAINGYPMVKVLPGIYTDSRDRGISLNTSNILLYTEQSFEGTIIDCQREGRAFTIANSRPVISGFVIQNGYRPHSYGGGIYVYSGSPFIVNCVFMDNSAAQGGGLYIESSARPVLQNCTLLNSKIHDAQGRAIIRNTIIWGNYAGQIYNDAFRQSHVTYSCIKGGYSGAGNIASDPMMWGWRLTAASPCINAGQASSAPGRDIDGEARGALIDVGADEWVDMDSDNLLDAWELFYFGDLSDTEVSDHDSDGLVNLDEYLQGTRPDTSDSDVDGLTDGEEVHTHQTDPLDVDTDQDQMHDGWEVEHRFDPLSELDLFSDPDGDHIPNLYEYVYETDPHTVSPRLPVTTYVFHDCGTLQQAIDETKSDFAIIQVGPGIYRGPGNYDIDIRRESPLLLVAEKGPLHTIIDAEDQGPGFYISGQGPVILDGFTLQHAKNTIRTTGGGIFTYNGKLGLLNSRIQFCSARGTGGAVAGHYGSTLLLENTLLAHNEVEGYGGAFYATDSDVLLNHCSLIYNQAFSGGGLYAERGSARFINSIAWSNTPDALISYQTTITARYSHIQMPEGEVWEGIGNQNIEPLLNRHGYPLTQAPVIDTAEDSGLAVDMLGFSRWDHPLHTNLLSTADCGAFEFVDTDNDGVLDAWEIYHFTNLTPSAIHDSDNDGLGLLYEYESGADPWVPDTDNDGLTDGEEVLEHHTDPSNPDTDGDQMEDQWEVTHGLNPQVDDAEEDPDADGLNNREERLEQTHPFEADSDQDGMPDGWEVSYDLNPLNAEDAIEDADEDRRSNLDEYLQGSHPQTFEFHDFDVVDRVVVLGVHTTNQIGEWVVDGESLLCAGLRGGVEYIVTAPTQGVFQLQVDGAAHVYIQEEEEFELLVYLDGAYLGRHTLTAVYTNHGGVVQLYTPWFPEGEHTVRIFWDNEKDGQPAFKINKIRLQELVGPDEDSPGMIERFLDQQCGVEKIAQVSYVSPVCVEGRGRFRGLMSMSAHTNSIDIYPAPHDRWYVNIPLSIEEPVEVAFSFQHGGKQEEHSITWLPLNLLQTNEVVLRKDDALWLTAHPQGVTNGQVFIDLIEDTSYTTTPDQPMVHTFDQAGIYEIRATYIDTLQYVTTNTVTVQVVESAFDGSPAACIFHRGQQSRTRTWRCPDLAPEAVIEHDDRIYFEETGASSRIFKLRVDAPEERYVIARSGVDGPILSHAILRGFYLFSSRQVYVKRVEVDEQGNETLAFGMVMSPVLEDVTANIDIFAGGISFLDGTREKLFPGTVFDETGEAVAYVLRYPAGHFNACHVFRAYQGSVHLGNR